MKMSLVYRGKKLFNNVQWHSSLFKKANLENHWYCNLVYPHYEKYVEM